MKKAVKTLLWVVGIPIGLIAIIMAMMGIAVLINNIQESNLARKAKNTIAQSPIAQRPASEDRKRYTSELQNISSTIDSLIANISEGIVQDEVKITVTNAWHFQIYQVRLQAAQNLWRLWAGIRSPSSPDQARIRIVDLNGNEVGGSRTIAGSMIWVQKD